MRINAVLLSVVVVQGLLAGCVSDDAEVPTVPDACVEECDQGPDAGSNTMFSGFDCSSDEVWFPITREQGMAHLPEQYEPWGYTPGGMTAIVELIRCGRIETPQATMTDVSMVSLHLTARISDHDERGFYEFAIVATWTPNEVLEGALAAQGIPTERATIDLVESALPSDGKTATWSVTNENGSFRVEHVHAYTFAGGLTPEYFFSTPQPGIPFIDQVGSAERVMPTLLVNSPFEGPGRVIAEGDNIVASLSPPSIPTPAHSSIHLRNMNFTQERVGSLATDLGVQE